MYQMPPQPVPYQQQQQQTYGTQKPGRGSPARPFESRGWGRGRGRGAPQQMGPGYHAGHQTGIGGAMGRLHRSAAQMADNIVPHLQLQTPLALSQVTCRPMGKLAKWTCYLQLPWHGRSAVTHWAG